MKLYLTSLPASVSDHVLKLHEVILVDGFTRSLFLQVEDLRVDGEWKFFFIAFSISGLKLIWFDSA